METQGIRKEETKVTSEEFTKAMTAFQNSGVKNTHKLFEYVLGLEKDIEMTVDIKECIKLSEEINGLFIAFDSAINRYPELSPVRESFRKLCLTYGKLLNDCVRLKGEAIEAKKGYAEMIKREVVLKIKPLLQRGSY